MSSFRKLILGVLAFVIFACSTDYEKARSAYLSGDADRAERIILNVTMESRSDSLNFLHRQIRADRVVSAYEDGDPDRTLRILKESVSRLATPLPDSILEMGNEMLLLVGAEEARRESYGEAVERWEEVPANSIHRRQAESAIDSLWTAVAKEGEEAYKQKQWHTALKYLAWLPKEGKHSEMRKLMPQATKEAAKEAERIKFVGFWTDTTPGTLWTRLHIKKEGGWELYYALPSEDNWGKPDESGSRLRLETSKYIDTGNRYWYLDLLEWNSSVRRNVTAYRCILISSKVLELNSDPYGAGVRNDLDKGDKFPFSP